MGGKHLQEAVPDGSAAVRYQPYPEYTLTNDERLLQLPAHWNIAPLRYLLNEPLTNGLFKKREHWGNGLRIVNVFDVYIKGDVVQETSLERVSCDITEQKKYSAEHGDFFFVRSSLKLEGIGKSASVLNPTEPMVFECHLVRGRPNTDTVCPKYLSYILNSSYCRQSLISLANQVTMTTIDQEKFKSLKISYPDLHEQQTIAAFLDYKTAKIDALIAKKKALLDKLLEKRTALISHTVTKGLDPKVPMRDSGIDWLGEIPAHWEVKRLRFTMTTNPSKSEIKLQTDELVSFIPMESVGELGGLSLDFEKTIDEVSSGYTYFADSDVVVAKITPCFENGKGALAHGLKKGIAFGTTELHVLRAGHELSSEYLFNLTMTHPFRKIGESEMFGAGGQKRIPERFIRDFRIGIPPVREQHRINDFIQEMKEKLSQEKESVQTVIARLQEYRSALITNAVTGKVDVRNFRLPEAEELVNHG